MYSVQLNKVLQAQFQLQSILTPSHLILVQLSMVGMIIARPSQISIEERLKKALKKLEVVLQTFPHICYNEIQHPSQKYLTADRKMLEFIFFLKVSMGLKLAMELELGLPC